MKLIHKEVSGPFTFHPVGFKLNTDFGLFTTINSIQLETTERLTDLEEGSPEYSFLCTLTIIGKTEDNPKRAKYVVRDCPVAFSSEAADSLAIKISLGDNAKLERLLSMGSLKPTYTIPGLNFMFDVCEIMITHVSDNTALEVVTFLEKVPRGTSAKDRKKQAIDNAVKELPEQG